MQVFLLLRRRAVLLEQFTRPSELGTMTVMPAATDRLANLGDDHRLGLRRKAETTMLLGNQHAEEALVLENCQSSG